MTAVIRSTPLRTITTEVETFEHLIEEFRAGRMVIMTDDPDRENEGDLVIASSAATPDTIRFMMNKGRGLVCLTMSREMAEALRLTPQVEQNNSRYFTPFTVSIDHVSVGEEGVTARGRARTIDRVVRDWATMSPDELRTPGSVFPLVAHPMGVLGRRGQTEGSVDLARVSGLERSGVICEILNSDGSMMRGEALLQFARDFSLPIISVAEIASYIVHTGSLLRRSAATQVDSPYGPAQMIVFENGVDSKEHLVTVFGDLTAAPHGAPLVRIHSECVTGDVFGSRRCDCGAQLTGALKMIASEGTGIVLYLRQEGRGIGLYNKIQAYALQDEGHDTVDANVHLGFPSDLREFGSAAAILKDLGLHRVRLLTNNPDKIKGLEEHGITIEARIPLLFSDPESARYQETKRTKLGHLMDDPRIERTA